jgi:threonylcarbamoyladenosine tRNA methylthiotransferase MtaB
MERVAFTTLGCKVNQYETEAMSELFKKKGYVIVDFDETADIYVINTCTVTSFGDKKSRQMIRKAKHKNKDAIIAVAGCYSQVSPDKVMAIPGVNVVIGTSDRDRIVDFIEEYKKSRTAVSHVENIMNVRKFEELEIAEYRGRTRAFLKIQDGCNRFCSYCLIPYARGPIRSRQPEKVISQAKRLADSGFKEIILSGIHVASYGVDLGVINLVDIIEMLQKIDGIERIRIGSVEPTFFTDDVIERLKKYDKLCRHFHLSLQSGCDETLKRMNRRYTTSQYESIVQKLRDAFPKVSITTDIITGFPGETDEEFNLTYGFLEKLKLSKTHVFKYSPRKGTLAARYKHQVPPEVKEERSQKLLALNLINEKNFIEKFIGSDMKVLFEAEVKGMKGFIEGYTDNYISVRANGNDDLIDTIANCRLTKNCGTYACGEIV